MNKVLPLNKLFLLTEIRYDKEQIFRLSVQCLITSLSYEILNEKFPEQRK